VSAARRALAFTLSLLMMIGCGPEPAAEPAPPPSAAAPVTTRVEVCPPPGTVRADWPAVGPKPEGVESEPCEKCGQWLLEGWTDCPRCAWRR
jgi:hypothetical protein